MTDLRILTCGDPHVGGYSSQPGNLQKVVNFANQAFDQGKLDILAFLGDLTESANTSYAQTFEDTIKNLRPNLTRLLVCGNHDVSDGHDCISNCASSSKGQLNPTHKSCIFTSVHGIYPDQFYTFTKGLKTYNIIIPGICWTDPNPSWYFNFNNPNIDRSLPTFIFNHGPVYGFSGFNGYASSVQQYLSNFSTVIACYAGHTHGNYNQMFGNTRQIVNNQTFSNYIIGYTRVNDNNTTDYTTLDYRQSFVDPFPTSCPAPTCEFSVSI